MRIRTKVWLREKSSQVLFHPLTRGRFCHCTKTRINPAKWEPLLTSMAQKCFENQDLYEIRDLWKLLANLAGCYSTWEELLGWRRFSATWECSISYDPKAVSEAQLSLWQLRSCHKPPHQLVLFFVLHRSLKEYWRIPWISPSAPSCPLCPHLW